MSLPNRVRLTAGRVADFSCPTGKSQSFMWDTDAPSLALRATPTGRKTFVFESRLMGATLRINIGTVTDWPIDKARSRARSLKMLVDAGKDPRQVERQQTADDQTAADLERQRADRALVTVADAWAAYLIERKPFWGERHYRDHVALSKAGGELSVRGTRGRGITVPGPLYPLLELRLCELDANVIEAWAARETITRPTPARLAWRILKAFLAWCAEQSAYADLLPTMNPAKTRKAREVLGKPGIKQDALMREQLPAWFMGVRNISSPVISAYLQTVLLIGARPGEVLAIQWTDLDLQWRRLTIRDKVEGERTIPLTPYVASLMAALPRRNAWVFSSATAKSGRQAIPRSQHVGACKAVGIDGLTLHGLRRSFKSLTEWLEIPAGVVAQIMGHKPSATAEKHYTVRPLDLLRVHHERIEAWILEQAGVTELREPTRISDD